MGNTWFTQNIPITNSSSIYFFDNFTGWIVGSGGSILKTTDGGVTFVEDDNHITYPNGFYLYQNYTNPFNPSTTISFTLAEKSNVTLKVIDILGREVATLLNGEKEAGKHNITFNTSNLSSGMYIYTLQVSSYSISKKMLLLK